METTDKEYPQVKNLDGSYFRVLRNGKFVERCFTDMTTEEQDDFLETLDKDCLKAMVKTFGNALRGLCDMCHIEGTEENEDD